MVSARTSPGIHLQLFAQHDMPAIQVVAGKL
jgi:hypothetical protein